MAEESRQVNGSNSGRSSNARPDGAAPAWLMAVIGLLVMGLSALVLARQFGAPSDGARISTLGDGYTAEGVAIQVFAADSPLRDGDRVIAVEATTLPVYADRLWQPGNWGTRWEAGQALHYRVIRQGQEVDVMVRLGRQPVQELLVLNWGVLLFTITFQVIAVFVLFSKPRDAAAQALFMMGITLSYFYLWSSYLQVADIIEGYGFWSFISVHGMLWLGFWAASLHLSLTFPLPLPRLAPRPRLVWLIYPITILAYLVYLALSRLFSTNWLEWLKFWNPAYLVVALTCFSLIVIAFIRQYRLHRSGPARQKIQWVIFSFLISGGLVMITSLIPQLLGRPPINNNLIGIILLPMPIAIAIAILRYQLFDINLIIHRTLVYSALTLALATVFFLAVTILQALFQAVSGQRSAISVVISTLAIAALFNPLRRRVQDFIDRRFYRRKYNAEQALKRFAEIARNETDIEKLQVEIMAVVQETMQPEKVGLWLRESKK